MIVRELSRKEREALSAAHFGRLGCARENQPYVVPIFFAAEEDSIYSFAIPGQKIDWMRDNPQVCLQFDNLSDGANWTSVVIFGQFLELVDTPEHRDERRRAHTLLQARPMWWEPAALSTVGGGASAGYVPISSTSMTGYGYSTPPHG